MLDRALLGLVRAAGRRVRGGAAAWRPSTRRSAQQFGKPLSTFQGVALKAADAYIDTEAIRVTVLQAAWKLDVGRPTRRPTCSSRSGGRPRAASASCTSRQHLHGGMGADIDYPVHRYFLWGKQIEDTLGGASATLAPARRRHRGSATREHDTTTTSPSLRYDDVSVGDELPPLPIPLTRTLIVATAIASRDYQDVHHDPGLAQRARLAGHLHEHPHHATGSSGRYVTDWAGPDARAQVGEDPPRRAELPGRHDDDDRRGHGKDDGARRGRRSRARTRSATTSAAPSRWCCRVSERRERAARQPARRRRDRRDRRDRVLEGLGPLRAAARGRGVRGRDRRRRASSPSQVDGMVTFTADTNPEIEIAKNLGVGELTFFSRIHHGGGAACGTIQQAVLAVNAGVADYVVVLPRVQRALGPPLRRRRAGPRRRWRRPRARTSPGTRRTGCSRPRSGSRCSPGATCTSTARPARTSAASRSPTASTRPTNPKAWFYEQPDHARGPPGVALDRRAAAPARLLPGERRRPGARRHHARAGPRPAEPAGDRARVGPGRGRPTRR